jgi:hypothetical protein
MKTLYVNRSLVNTSQVNDWALKQGFKTTLDELHTTIAYSKKALDWNTIPKSTPTLIVRPAVNRTVTTLGDQGAIVLKFESPQLHARWSELLALGATWDYPTYQAHVTISYPSKGIDLNKIVPYVGPLEFGEEIWKELDPNWEAKES